MYSNDIESYDMLAVVHSTRRVTQTRQVAIEESDHHPITMVKQTKQNLILDRSSSGSAMTKSGVRVPGHLLKNGLQDSGVIVGQARLCPVRLLEEK